MLHIVPSYDGVEPDNGLVKSWKVLLLVLSNKHAVFNGYCLFSYSCILFLHQKFWKKDG